MMAIWTRWCLFCNKVTVRVLFPGHEPEDDDFHRDLPIGFAGVIPLFVVLVVFLLCFGG